MLGLILIYFIGKHFYDLAAKHKKSEYLFAILGVVSYYVGTFVFGIILFFILGEDAVLEMNEFLSAIIGLPAGLLTCYLFYKFLENSWSKTRVGADSNILDDFDD